MKAHACISQHFQQGVLPCAGTFTVAIKAINLPQARCAVNLDLHFFKGWGILAARRFFFLKMFYSRSHFNIWYTCLEARTDHCVPYKKKFGNVVASYGPIFASTDESPIQFTRACFNTSSIDFCPNTRCSACGAEHLSPACTLHRSACNLPCSWNFLLFCCGRCVIVSVHIAQWSSFTKLTGLLLTNVVAM